VQQKRRRLAARGRLAMELFKLKGANNYCETESSWKGCSVEVVSSEGWSGVSEEN
jgi:hypothetical protein